MHILHMTTMHNDHTTHMLILSDLSGTLLMLSLSRILPVSDSAAAPDLDGATLGVELGA